MIKKLILGTVQLGLDYGINNRSGKPTHEKACEILHCAYDNGIRILDTAEAYGNSQEVIGAFLKENPEKQFHVISKLTANHGLLKNELFDHIAENLKILSLDQLYGYMFHNYNSFKTSTFLYDEVLQSKALD
ncbi:MAG: aldo/keto reductase, partial [Gelidibacter sp.]